MARTKIEGSRAVDTRSENRPAEKKWKKSGSSRRTDAAILKKHGYSVGEEIGKGTFAKVCLAQWTNGTTNTTIAVKVIDRHIASKEFVEKFMPRELAIWPQMKHSNIIEVFSVITINERSYIFMELAENSDVIEYLQTNGAVPESTARKWIDQLVKALKFCHRKGVAHRDVKCENLLLDKGMNIKLTDFGFSRFCMDNVSHRRMLSETYCGSAAYVAPEVLRGAPYNPLLSDVWSVGICLFVMLNNSMPFDDANLLKLYKDQMCRRWKFRSRVEPHLSDQLKLLVNRMLEPDIFRRANLESVSRSAWFRPEC